MKIKAVQLDLARQIETLEYIRRFIDFAAGSGFNTLALYLEGRVKTAAFPYLPERESYSLQAMEKIVKLADAKKMDVIPVVSNLGHTEHFLGCAPLAHLAELRGDRAGRFSSGKRVVCPSLEATYRFFEAYLAEVSAVFPSPYFHVGNDEVDDLGFCSLCKKRLQNGETLSDIFAGHLRRTHAFITGRLGKRMLIWDDMFEFYPEALARMPRDIIMCAWHYDSLADKPHTHFGTTRRFNPFAAYNRMGFDFLICPCELSPRNVAGLTAYAAPYAPLGAWLTTWEKKASFLEENLPTIAFAGRCWQAKKQPPPDEAYREVCRKLFGVAAPEFLDAMLAVKNQEPMAGPSALQEFLRGPLTRHENERAKQAAFLVRLLPKWRPRVRSRTGRRVFGDIVARLGKENIYHRLRAVIDLLEQERVPAGHLAYARQACSKIMAAIKAYAWTRKKQWRALRPGINSSASDKACRTLAQAAQQLQKRIGQCRGLGPRLNIRYFLPDQYGSQKVALSVQLPSGKWRALYCGVPKGNFADFSQTPYYGMTCLLAAEQPPPRKVRIESWGYGGIGVAYLEIVAGRGTYRPAGIALTRGMVKDPQNVLVDDTRWAYLGEPDSGKAYFIPCRARKKHVLEIKLTGQPV